MSVLVIVPILIVVPVLIMKPGADGLGMQMVALRRAVVSMGGGMGIRGVKPVKTAALRLVRMAILIGLPELIVMSIGIVLPMVVAPVMGAGLARIVVSILVLIILSNGGIPDTDKQRT